MADLADGNKAAGAEDGASSGAAETYSKSVVAILGTLQITGVLAACGFIVKFSREDFLGFSSGSWEVSQLGSLAGAFALDSATLLSRYVLEYQVLFGLIIGFVLYILAQEFVQQRYSTKVWILHLCTYLVLSAAMAAVFLSNQAPTLYLRDFLILNPRMQPHISAETPGYEEVNDLCRLIFGSRVAHDPSRFAVFPILKGFRLTERSAADFLDARYARSLLVCVISWIFLLTSARKEHMRTYGLPIVSAFVLLLLIVTAMVPYSYGKLIHSTLFPTADIQYQEAKPDVSDMEIKNVEAPLLFQNDKTVGILSTKDGITSVVYIPTERVMRLHLYGTEDALKVVLENEAPPAAPPPPL